MNGNKTSVHDEGIVVALINLPDIGFRHMLIFHGLANGSSQVLILCSSSSSHIQIYASHFHKNAVSTYFYTKVIIMETKVFCFRGFHADYLQ